MDQKFFKRKIEEKDRQAVGYLPELSKAEAELLFVEAKEADLEELLAVAKKRKNALTSRCGELKKQKDKMFFLACFYRNLLKGEFKQAASYLIDGTVDLDILSEVKRHLQDSERTKLKQAFENRFLKVKEEYADVCNRCQIGLPIENQAEAEAQAASLQEKYESLQILSKFL